jgi:uncharacterized protein (DUF488 family)
MLRLNNTSQLAGFTKRDDLRYFLREIGSIDYLQIPALAPTQEILDAFKKNKGNWIDYESAFNSIMVERRIENEIKRETAHEGCLLCSEKKPQHCHRRLVAEYLRKQWNDVRITHLV